MVKAEHFIMMSSHTEMMDAALNTAKLAGVLAKLRVGKDLCRNSSRGKSYPD
jgi:hypothetical protein